MKKNMIFTVLALILLLVMCACGQNTSSNKWQKQYDLGVQYLSDENYDDAISAFSAAIEIDPEKVDAYIGRADAYMKKGSNENLLLAQKDCDTAIELEPKRWEAYQKKNVVLTMMGDYVEGLAALYQYKEVNPSADAEEAIQNYLERISFNIETEAVDKQPKAHFIDKTIYDLEDTCEKLLYIVLTDTQTGEKQVAASLLIKYFDNFGFEADSIELVKNQEDSWLFYIWLGFGKTATFMYNMHSNQILTLESDLTKWNFVESYLIGESMTMVVGDEEDLFVYDWSGKLLYEMKDIIGTCIIEDRDIYYAKATIEERKIIYNICKIKIGDYTSSTVCTVELKNGSGLWLNEGKIEWYDIDAKSQTPNSMDIHDPHDIHITLEEVNDNKQTSNKTEIRSSGPESAFYNTHWLHRGPAGTTFDLVFYSDGTWFSQALADEGLKDSGNWLYDNGDLIISGDRYEAVMGDNGEVDEYVYTGFEGGNIYLWSNE